MDPASDYLSVEPTSLPYDDVHLPEGGQASAPETSTSGRSLADRIGTTKVYLLSDASKSRGGKRKRDDEDDSHDIDMNEGDSQNRDNAILLKGSPISFLPTSGIFAYVTHFDANLLGLEWVDDTTCVLVFESTADARSAFRVLQKSLAEEPSRDDGTVTAKPIPVPIWPAEARINATLGRAGGESDGLRGILRMRWARADDVKKRGAREESQFYKTYGDTAGKLLDDGPVGPLVKRRRGEPADADEAMERAKLDAELDKFIAGDDAPDPEPMSRMRSDYIGRDGKTLLDRTSDIRAHPVELEDRVTAPLPRRARGRRGGDRQERDDGPAEPRSGGGRGNRDRTRGHRQPRPRLTQADLDAELDAFLKRDD